MCSQKHALMGEIGKHTYYATNKNRTYAILLNEESSSLNVAFLIKIKHLFKYTEMMFFCAR